MIDAASSMAKETKSPGVGRLMIWIGIFLRLLTLTLGILWLSSYYVGLQRYQSNWSSKGTEEIEEARWFISNFGSFGYAWRSQDGELGIDLPTSDVRHTAFKGSSSALNHIHAEGAAAWHWFHYLPTENKTMGRMQTGYGQLFIPYWVLFMVSGFLTVLLSNRIRRSSFACNETVATGKNAEENEMA